MVILIGETEQIGKSIGNSSGVVAVFFINSRLITAGEKAELFHFFRSDVQVPCQKIAENTVAGLFTVIFNGGGAFLFFFQLFTYLIQVCCQLIFIHGLCNIIFHIVAHGFLCIFKIGIAAENQDRAFIITLPGKTGHLQAAQAWHTDIQKGDIRLFFQNCSKGFLSVRGFSHTIKTQFLPVNQLAQTLPDFGFIIRNKICIHNPLNIPFVMLIL